MGKEKVQEDFSLWEKPIFEAWKDAGYFLRTPGFGEFKGESYTIVIPPPNITGVLHLGHALNDSIQDACIRHARMQGKRTRWILGTDHAGIATQTKVDKHLAEQGINRREIGREAFIEACQRWRDEYGTTIVNQIAAMGCSCDYEHEQFTMNPDFSLAVRRVFVDWYHNGIIYRGKRIVNWCPHCTTAIADDEAEYEDEAGHLWHLRYPLVEPVDGVEYLVVATTRPETMLGDTGVAVNPKDGRYKNLIGKTVRLPIVDRVVPIFADYYVDSEFGTGAVKVTPAHDPNDFAMGARAGLDVVNIFDENANVVPGFGRFSGMTRDEARKAVVEEFEALGLLDHIDDHDHSVMHCYRCHTTLEPWLSEQWFVDVDKLKEPAFKAVHDQKIKFYPSRWAQVYLDWLENLKDWCISRQLWWGHRIPMFYCDECGWSDASVEDLEICPECGSPLRQDEDVLDTWFSSQLWPFATQGWAQYGKESEEIRDYYPTQVLSTARDIMGLWVARMVMASEYCVEEIPFHDVIIHPTVMGSDGKPMSKSRGNGVDPVDLMRNYGADGMRFGLLSQVTGSQSMRFDEQKIENARNFANKIRNAARFVNMNLAGFKVGSPSVESDVDKWMFSRLARLTAAVDAQYESYEFGEMTRLLYSFFWNEFCDWYIEFSKPRLNAGNDGEDRQACLNNLVFILNQSLRLLHPIMPFVTEQIYKDLPVDKTDEPMLIIASWPRSSELEKYIDDEAETSIDKVCDVISSTRSIRARYGLSPKTELEVRVKAEDSVAGILEAQHDLIVNLGVISSLDIAPDIGKFAQSAVDVSNDIEVYVDMAGHIDLDAERARLQKEKASLEKDIAKFEKKLSNEGFLSKADPQIIQKDRDKLAGFKEKIMRVEAQLVELA